jgi:hemolysin activation/secretion protein
MRLSNQQRVSMHRNRSRAIVSSCLLLFCIASKARGEEAVSGTPASDAPPNTAPATPQPTIYIREYRVTGTKVLPPIEVERAVYPFLGPMRTTDDVEQARQALEKAYRDKGYQTVTVEIPAQRPRRGVIVMQVTENKVGRLRVNGARWFLPDQIRRHAPSLAPGVVPNFDDVTRDIIALNQLGDRRVTPVLQQGVEPGTVDIELNVKDKFPLHGSVEINNRYSPNTTPLRLNGSISYNNLWQLGHSVGFSGQVAPERQEDALVYSGYYLFRAPSWQHFSLILQGTKQDSNVSTLGGAAVAGRGEIAGLRAMITLPARPKFFHSVSFGFDYKHFDENVAVGADTFVTPIEYWPFTVSYGASWNRDKSFSELNLAMNFHARGMGSEPVEFDNKRYNADGSYLYARGDVSHTQDLPGGFQAYAKAQGQITGEALINSEQFAGGGLATARGYLESEALGDNALFGTVELRSPSIFGRSKNKEDGTAVPHEWRVYGFLEGGRLTINDPLPEQIDRNDLASWGFGSRMRLFGHLNGSVDVSFPLIDANPTLQDDMFVSFRAWAEF